MTHVESAYNQSSSGGEKAVLLRNIHVTRELANACDPFPMKDGEWGVVELADREVVYCEVHNSMASAREDYKSRRK